MNSTKTGGHPYRREQSFDAPLRDGRTLHECIPDPNVPSPEDQDAEAQNTSDDNDDIIGMREAVLQSSIGIDPDPKLVPLHLSRVFSASITGGQTRGLLWSLYENVGDDANWRSEALKYIFGLKDGRQVPFLELLAPARQFWSGKAAQQNAWTLLNRAQSQLRANLLTALAATDDDLFLTYLFRFARTDAWRKGTVDRLSAVRDQLKQHAPAQLHALSGLTLPTLRRAITVLGTFQRKAKGKERIPAFLGIYSALRYVGLFTRADSSAADAVGPLHSAITKLLQDGSAESLMLMRALERPLHLLHVPDEWDDFIDELLNWIDDPRGEGAVFAAYTACYYLDSLDLELWQGIVTPSSIDRPWTYKAVHTMLEESIKNVKEIGYLDPHHTVINTLRVINYLRAHSALTPQCLQRRERNVCLHLARKGEQAALRLAHPRVNEVHQWCAWLERQSSFTS